MILLRMDVDTRLRMGCSLASWSSYDDYYGWAPLGYGNNINISFGSIPYNNWTFIPRRNICDRDLNRYYVSHRQDNRFRNAVVINNYYNGRGNIGRFVRGPERSGKLNGIPATISRKEELIIQTEGLTAIMLHRIIVIIPV
ncbi:MAG: hypothetical protein IPL50_21100 [Chitinophagaceae bacterium]|nr:hypothetical protein [Chitinophagaceae bacterium]